MFQGKKPAIDWTACRAVEVVQGRLSGVPVIKDSRVRPEDLIINRDEGAEWLAENFGLPIEAVREILSFYEEQKERALSH